MAFPWRAAPKSDLLQELRWYLEVFLSYPFSPETEHAERVLTALKSWGRQAFLSLFHDGRARDFYRDASRDGHTRLQLQIVADDPRVLSWPWEALEDPETGTLAQLCQIERRLNAVNDPLPLPELPQDCVNILLVTARPYDRDVAYGSISRPMVELVAQGKLPARIKLLRPPTLASLERELTERPGHYHIVHFDGHGGYGTGGPTVPHQMFDAPQGRLVFENDKGGEDAIEANTLGTLLREHKIPAVVLNACQSAMIDENAEDPFASVAASLLKAGVRNVVAMSHSLYVTAAEQFVPAFYERLFTTGSFAEATRAGRKKLLADPKRVCARGRFPLTDWIVPGAVPAGPN